MLRCALGRLPVRAWVYAACGGQARLSSSYVKLESTQVPGVHLVRLNRPDKLNSLTVEVGEQFEAVVGELKQTKGLRAVVLTGEGRAFSAGGDLQFLLDRAEHNVQDNAAEMLRFYSRFLSLRSIPVPVIAAINGAAVGAGMCLAMACDMRVALGKAKMSVNFTRIGIHPGLAATHFLPMVAGPQFAAKMLLTGGMITGEEARARGLVLDTYETQEEVLDAAMSLAKEIAEASPVAVKEVTETLRNSTGQGLDQALQREASAQGVTYNAPDMIEGLAAVREKRTPNYSQ